MVALPLPTTLLVLPFENYPRHASRVTFVNRLLDQLRSIPGVRQAAVSSGLPFTTDGLISKTIFPEGVDPTSGDSLRAHYFSAVTPNYWSAMNISLLQGRFIEDSDTADPARVAVIDEALARQHWPNGNAIGSRFSTTAYSEIDKKIFGAVGSSFEGSSAYTVVGIVGNVKQTDLAETQQLGAIYVPFTHSIKLQLILRAAVPPSALAPSVQRLVRQLDPHLPVDDFKTMQARLDDSLVTRRSPALLAAVFAGGALFVSLPGNLRRPGLRCRSAPSRDRRAHGARCGTGTNWTPVLDAWITPARHGRLAGRHRSLGGWPTHAKYPLRSARIAPSDAGDHSPDHGRGHADRVPVASHARQSD